MSRSVALSRDPDGYEEIRTAQQPYPDTFSPTFELGTDAHVEWVRTTIAEFTRLQDEEQQGEEEEE